MSPTPDPDVVGAINAELALHDFGSPGNRQEMANHIARRLLRDCGPAHTLDVEVVSVVRSSFSPTVLVQAGAIDDDGHRLPDDRDVSWWCAAEAAPPVGTKLRAEIREAT